MKLYQLQYFEAVCKHGGVTRAAAELSVSQPSVSAAIKELEGEFHINLFHRHKQRLILTREGELFLQGAQKILGEVEELGNRMRDFGDAKNHIRLGMPPMIGTFLFPSIFSRFKGLYPDIAVEIVEHGSMHVRRMVKEDQLELAIVVTNGLDDPELGILNFYDTELLYCVAESSPFAGREGVSLEEVAGQPLVMFKKDFYQSAAIYQRFQALGERPDVILFSNQLYTVKQFIGAGIASGFLFREIVGLEKGIAGLPVQPSIAIEIGLIWKKNRHVYSDVARFIDFIKQGSLTGENN